MIEHNQIATTISIQNVNDMGEQASGNKCASKSKLGVFGDEYSSTIFGVKTYVSYKRYLLNQTGYQMTNDL